MRDDVWERIDSAKWGFGDFSPWNVIRNVSMWRNYFWFCVVSASVAWMVFGFDSTWSMVKPFVDNIGALVNGSISLRDVWGLSQAYYGVGNHFSAIVIYGLLWIRLSNYYEGMGIRKSFNFCITTGLSLASIGVFEWIYNSLYAYYQGQGWVVSWQYKQVTNLISFSLFAVVGVLIVLYMIASGYRPRLDRWFVGLFLLSLFMWGLWIHYPFGSTPVGVVLDNGSIYMSGPNFPQTYYAIDIAPWDNVAIGEPYYMQNDLLHFVNTFCKVVFTAMTGYFFMWVKPKS